VKLAGRIASAMSVKHVLYIDWLSAAIAAAVCVCVCVGVCITNIECAAMRQQGA